MNKKKALFYILKIIVAAALLAGLVVLWAFLAFMLSSGGLLNSHLTPGATFLLVIISILMAAGYIAFALWLSRLGKEKLNGGKQSAANRFIKPILTLVLPAIGIVILIAAGGEIRYKISQAQARSYVKKSDVQLSYGINDYYGIMSTDLNKNTVLVDFSLHRVTFIFHVDFDQMLSVELKHTESAEPEGKKIQYQFDIKDEGATLTTYYTPSDSSDCERFTDGVQLELSDGSVWYSDIEKDYIGFDTALTGNILEAEDWAEEILGYGNKVMPDYCAGYDRQTVFINLDVLSLRVLYEQKGTACLRKFDFHYVGDTAEIENTDIQQVFELYNGGVLIACRDVEVRDDRTVVFVYISPEKEYYATDQSDWGYYGFGVSSGSEQVITE